MTTKIVRRRTRRTKVATFDVDDIGTLKESVGATLGQNLDKKYFANPKRKDCKMETSVEIICKNDNKEKKKSSKTKTNSKSAKLNAKPIHVPSLTRSQKTKTIDKFFKINTSEKLKNEPVLGNISPISSEPQHACITSEQININDLSDDTEDTCTELSDEYQSLANGYHRQIEMANIDDSDSGVTSMGAPYYCVSRSSTDNIFLQEPVLSLNVDKTPNQASSFKINKELAMEPVFSSSSSSSTTTTLSGQFHPIVTPDDHSLSNKEANDDLQTKSNYYLFSLDNDNSSCDSGIAFTSSDNSNLVQNVNGQRKPATPHRILCPSPIKLASSNCDRNKSPSADCIVTSSTIINEKNLSPQRIQLKKYRKKLNLSRSPSKRKHKSRKDQHNDAKIIDEDKNEKISSDENLDKVSELKNVAALNAVNANANLTISKVNRINNGGKTKTFGTAANGNREINEYFVVRKSLRKTKTAIEEEMNRKIEKAILEEQCDGLRVGNFEGKGRGIIADRQFERGDFVVEYIGDLINMTEAGRREKRYALDENTGCYMYYFKHKNQQYCIDATADTGKFGRLINHSRNGNLMTKIVVVKSRPHLVLIAKDDIEPGEELTYDYGDRSKEALLHHPWLAF